MNRAISILTDPGVLAILFLLGSLVWMLLDQKDKAGRSSFSPCSPIFSMARRWPRFWEPKAPFCLGNSTATYMASTPRWAFRCCGGSHPWAGPAAAHRVPFARPRDDPVVLVAAIPFACAAADLARSNFKLAAVHISAVLAWLFPIRFATSAISAHPYLLRALALTTLAIGAQALIAAWREPRAIAEEGARKLSNASENANWALTGRLSRTSD
jgi:hypothetical protein